MNCVKEEQGVSNTIADNAIISEGVILGDNVLIGRNAIIKSGCIIGNNVMIGDNAYIDYNVIIRDNVRLGERAFVGARTILGEYLVDFISERQNNKHVLIIGKDAVIRSETIIYGGSFIGEQFQTGHRVTIREKSTIGNHVRIGTLSDIQGDCKIGDYVNMHSNVHIGQKSTIHNYVWIFPYVVLTNDPNPPSEELFGVNVEEFAVIATGSVVLPGITVGEESLVGAGSIVTKDVEKSHVVVGNPAKDVGETTRIKNKLTGEQVYPWKKSFSRGMPWSEMGYEEWNKGKN